MQIIIRWFVAVAKSQKVIMWVTEIWGTVEEPGSLLDYLAELSWTKIPCMEPCASERNLSKDRRLLSPPNGPPKSTQPLFMVSLNLKGYFFKMRPSFLGEETLCILIASCKNQVARVSGFWSLAKQTYESWLLRQNPGVASRIQGLERSWLVYLQKACLCWPGRFKPHSVVERLCLSSFPLLLFHPIKNTSFQKTEAPVTLNLLFIYPQASGINFRGMTTHRVLTNPRREVICHPISPSSLPQIIFTCVNSMKSKNW